MPQPPRKRAPAAKKVALKVVKGNKEDLLKAPLADHQTNGKGEESAVRKFKASGKKVGYNRQRNLDNEVLNSGPDMPPGRYMSWLPKPEEVPPKPKEAPEMEWPGIGHHSRGNPEWQLYSEIAPDAKQRYERGEPWVLDRYWVVRWVPPNDRRCKARSIGKFAHYQGNRCTMVPIKGGSVCPTHGGNLTTVRKAAQRALATAALPAAEKLIHIALRKSGVSDADRIKALVQILDRAGVEGRSTIELEIKPWQAVLEKVYSEQTGKPVDDEEVEGIDYDLEGEEDDDDE